MKRDLLRLYQNYLYALREKQLYGDKYGDTDEIIKMYEDILEIKPNKNVKLKVKENKYEK